LLALKWLESTCCTSYTVSFAVATSSISTNSSAVTYLLKNKFWLNAANFSADTQFDTSALLFNIPQKRVG
jgi:hypothetical protein